MSASGLEAKFDIKKYVEKVKSLWKIMFDLKKMGYKMKPYYV
jgi:hypothetical protein